VGEKLVRVRGKYSRRAYEVKGFTQNIDGESGRVNNSNYINGLQGRVQ
jgi:hypothetical protein